MKTYTVSGVVKLELYGEFNIKARSQGEAEDKMAHRLKQMTDKRVVRKMTSTNSSYEIISKEDNAD